MTVLLIAGGRDITMYPQSLENLLVKVLDLETYAGATDIITGDAPGMDATARGLARIRRFHLHVFRADWDAYGRAAGPIRNRAMALRASELRSDGHRVDVILIWDGSSPGTASMKKEAQRLGFKPFEVLIDPDGHFDFVGQQ